MEHPQTAIEVTGSAEGATVRLAGVWSIREPLPEPPIAEPTLHTAYDSHSYARRGLTPLPVLRVKFHDPMETWD